MAEILILDSEFNAIWLFTQIESLIWEERFCEAGEFELYCLPTAEAQKYLRVGNRVRRTSDSEMICTIESITIQTDDDGITHWIATGHDVMYLLAQRIVADYYTYNNISAVSVCQDLLDKNATYASDNTSSERKLPITYTVYFNTGVVGDDDGGEPSASKDIYGNYRGENLYDTLTEICSDCAMGMRARLLTQISGDTSVNLINIDWYDPVDRSMGQTDNTPVFLSTDFGTLKSAEWQEGRTEDYSNVAYVAGDGEGSSRNVVEAGSSDSGEARYEIFVDARDLSSDGLTTSAYTATLKQRGNEKLSGGEMNSQTFTVNLNSALCAYRERFDLGDIVSIGSGNVYGIARVMGVTESIDENGTEWDVDLLTLSSAVDSDDDTTDDAILVDENDETLLDENALELEDSE